MAVNYAFGDVPIRLTASGAGTYSSGPLANAGQARMAEVLVHVSAASGTTVTLDVVIQTSPNGTTWTTVPGSAVTQLTAAGNARCCALVADEYVQVLATVAGTGSPAVTGSVGVLFL